MNINSQKNKLNEVDVNEPQYNPDKPSSKDMNTTIEKFNQNDSSLDKIKIQESQKYLDLQQQINSTIPTQINVPPHPKAAIDPQPQKLKVEDQNRSDGGDKLSCEATLSAYNKKSEALFLYLGETLSSHSLTSTQQRVRMIKKIFSSLNESE